MDLDRFDREILALLQRDGRMTSAALGQRVGLSPSACHRRVKAMERSGAIAGYAALVPERTQKTGATVFVAVTLENQRRETLEAFERAVVARPEVQDCYLMSGEADYLLRVVVDSLGEYERAHKEVLSQLPGVRRLISSFAIRGVLLRGSGRAGGE